MPRLIANYKDSRSGRRLEHNKLIDGRSMVRKVGIVLVHGVVRLFQPKDCEGASLAYWSTDGADQVEIEAVDEVHPQVVLTVQIDGRPFRALLDSGASTSLLAASDAARLGVTPETPGVVVTGSGIGMGAKKIDTWIGPFKSFTIGKETITNPRIVVSDLWKDTTYTRTGSNLRTYVGLQPILLGADFLLAHRVLVAHSQRKMYFTYEGGPMFQVNRPLEAGSVRHASRQQTIAN
jgi:hypothetical protein